MEQPHVLSSGTKEKAVDHFWNNELTREFDTPAARYRDFEKSLSFTQALRIYWRAALWIVYGQLVVFGYGIDGNIAANLIAIPQFQEEYGTPFHNDSSLSYIVDANWLAIFSGVSLLTAMIGAMVAGEVADRIGRRWTNLLFCVISIGGVAAQYWSRGSLGILTAGKAINGFPVGAWLVIAPLYASEVAPQPLRAVATAMTNIVQLSAVVLFTGIVYRVGPIPRRISYELPLACQWVVPSLVIITVWLWPESPVWLLRQGKVDAAEKVTRQLYGSGNRIDKQGLLAQVQETLDLEPKRQARYSECFHKAQRRRTLICMFVYGCQYLGGVVFVLGYQSYYYELIGSSSDKAFELTMINNALQLVANLCSWYLLTKIGQRPLIVWGQLCGAVCLLIIGGLSTIGTREGNIAVIVFIFIWSFTYQLSLGTAAWTVVATIPSLRFRARTQGLANLSLCFTQWVVTFTFPYLFNPDAGDLQGKVGFIFGATTFCAFLVVYFYLPETRGRSAAEISEFYEKGLSHRHLFGTDGLE